MKVQVNNSVPKNTKQSWSQSKKISNQKTSFPNQPFLCAATAARSMLPFWAFKGLRFEAVDLCVSSSTWHCDMNWSLKIGYEKGLSGNSQFQPANVWYVWRWGKQKGGILLSKLDHSHALASPRSCRDQTYTSWLVLCPCSKWPFWCV